jgi:hypothetical protein
LLDAVRLWKLGIPTVALAWDGFEHAAHAHARLHGVPDLPIQVVTDLKVGQTDNDQTDKGEAIAGSISALWIDEPVMPG